MNHSRKVLQAQTAIHGDGKLGDGFSSSIGDNCRAQNRSGLRGDDFDESFAVIFTNGTVDPVQVPRENVDCAAELFVSVCYHLFPYNLNFYFFMTAHNYSILSG